MKYIKVLLTEAQVSTLLNALENDSMDNSLDVQREEEHLMEKIRKARAKWAIEEART